MELVNQIFSVVMTNENWLINRIFGVFEKKNMPTSRLVLTKSRQYAIVGNNNRLS